MDLQEWHLDRQATRQRAAYWFNRILSGLILKSFDRQPLVLKASLADGPPLTNHNEAKEHGVATTQVERSAKQ